MTLKIEAGKMYRTRNGLTVRVLATDARDSYYPVVGLLDYGASGESVETWTSDGRSIADTRRTGSHDLIAEHREQRRFTLVFNTAVGGLDTWFIGDERSKWQDRPYEAVLVQEVLDGDR